MYAQGGTCYGDGLGCAGFGFDNTCKACGKPGQACCAGRRCEEGGCCTGSICVAVGSPCVSSGGGLCSSGSCGGCGGIGEPCCGVGFGTCSAPYAECDQASYACRSCGGPGETCCDFISCKGDSVCTYAFPGGPRCD